MRPGALGILYRQEGFRRLRVGVEETCFLQIGREAIRAIALHDREIRDRDILEQIPDRNRLKSRKSALVFAVGNEDRLNIAPRQQLGPGKCQSLLAGNDFQRGLRCKGVHRNQREGRQDPSCTRA